MAWRTLLSRGSRTSRHAIDTARHFFSSKTAGAVPRWPLAHGHLAFSFGAALRRWLCGNVAGILERSQDTAVIFHNVRLPDAMFFVKRLP
jgi:hypothetical protein